ncbi:MAG: hexokinase, partial [Candidatus Ornithospirochaeta sp.]
TDKVLGFFSDEMKKGLNGEKSSLAMIATYCQAANDIPDGESVIVMDAGGTNFRTCLVTFNEGKADISDFKRVSMPGIKKEVSASEFFSILADNIERFMGKSKKIGFCFSYAAEITEDHDGIPLMFSKEIKAPEVIGKRLGKELLSELSRRGYDTEGMTVSIVNDTVATLLAAKAAYRGDASTYIGFILGTGTNTAYVEKNSNIGKIRMEEGSQIVNVESGCLRLTLSEIDEEFMKTTKDSNAYHLEKKISGAYLGPFALHVLKKAAGEGVFSPSASSSINAMENLETKDMGLYLRDSGNKENPLSFLCASEEDAKNAYVIFRTIVERSAKLTAINLTAAVLASGEGEDPRRPVVINADGTTFYKTCFLEDYVKAYLDQILWKKEGRVYTIVNIDSSPTIGAAIAGLCAS